MPSLNHLTTLEAPSRGQGSIEAVEVNEVFRLEPDTDDATAVTQDEFIGTCKEFLGYTLYLGGGSNNGSYIPTDGKLHRNPPMQHPYLPNLWCTNIRFAPVPYSSPGYVGVNTNLAILFQQGQTAFNPPEKYAFWQAWDFVATFRALPYPQLFDKAITRQIQQQSPGQVGGAQLPPGVWYKDDGSSTNYVYYPEWLRNCEFVPMRDPAAVAHWKGGQMVFQTNSAIAGQQNPDQRGDPGSLPYQGEPYLPLPYYYVDVKWYGVPYRYITSPNSYITQYVNHINQYDIDFGRGSGIGAMTQGQILYLSYDADKYTDPYADPILTLDPLTGQTFTTPALFANITFHFKITKATGSNLPSQLIGNGGFRSAQVYLKAGQGVSAAFQNNPNWIVGGHNLMPHGKTRKFYYATAVNPQNLTDQTVWYPTFNSFPLELLFKDPDVAVGA